MRAHMLEHAYESKHTTAHRLMRENREHTSESTHMRAHAHKYYESHATHTRVRITKPAPSTAVVTQCAHERLTKSPQEPQVCPHFRTNAQLSSISLRWAKEQSSRCAPPTVDRSFGGEGGPPGLSAAPFRRFTARVASQAVPSSACARKGAEGFCSFFWLRFPKFLGNFSYLCSSLHIGCTPLAATRSSNIDWLLESVG